MKPRDILTHANEMIIINMKFLYTTTGKTRFNFPKGIFLTLFLLFFATKFIDAQTTYSWRNDQNPINNASWLSTTPYFFWNGSTGAIPPGGEILFFDGDKGFTMTNNLTALNRYGISFGNTNTPVSRTINGSSTNVFYDYSNGIPYIYNGSDSTHTINFPFQIGNTSTGPSTPYGMEINASVGHLNIGSTISANNSTGTKVLVLRSSSPSTGNITLSGAITNGSGTMSISKIESNTATLSSTGNAYTGATTITGGTLKLGAAGVIPNASAVTVSGTLDMNTFNETVGSIAGASTGKISSASGTPTLTAGGDNTSTTYAGLIENAIALTKTGTGTLTLTTTNNTYTGATLVSAGTLNIQRALSIGTIAGGVTVATNATLQLEGNIAVGAEALSISGDGTSCCSNGALFNVGGNNSWSGKISLPAQARINSNSGSLTLTDSILLGANTLIIQGATTSTNVISGAIAGTGSVNKVGTTTWTLSGANTFSGGVSFNNGSLNINHAKALGTGTFTLQYGAPGNTLTINNTSGAAIINTNNNVMAWNDDFIFTGTNTLNLGTGNVSLSANRQVTVSNDTLKVGGVISGAFTLTKAGGGTLFLSADNTYSGATTINAGTLKLGKGTNLTSAGPLGSNGAGTTINSNGVLDLNGNSFTASPNETITVNGNGISSGGELINSNSITEAVWSKGSIVLGSASSMGGAGNITFVGTTVVSGAFDLRKTGTGIINFSASVNTFGGVGKSLKIEQGTVIISADAGLGNASNSVILGTASSSGTLSIAPTATTTYVLPYAVLAGNGTIAKANTTNHATVSGIGTLTGTLTLNNQDASAVSGQLRISGKLTSTGAVIISNAGVAPVIYQNTANDYTGSTTITVGELRLNPSTTTATFASQVIMNGGTLSTSSIAATSTFTSSSTLKLNDNSTITLDAFNAHSLKFAASNGVAWVSGKILTINNWQGVAGVSGTVGKLFVGTTGAGLLASQLIQIYFTGYGPAMILSTGEIVPAAVSAFQFRSKQTGNWNLISTWEYSTDGTNWVNANITPNNTHSTVTIRNTHTVTVTVAVTVDEVTVQTGGIVDVNGAGNLTINNGTAANDFIVQGYLKLSNNDIVTNGVLYVDAYATFENAISGAFNSHPAATWNAASTCIITGVTSSSTIPANLSQSYGNFTWNCTNQSSNYAFEASTPSVSGLFKVQSTGIGSLNLAKTSTGRTWSTVDSMEIAGGTFNMAPSGTGAVGQTYSITVNNFLQTGGLFEICLSDVLSTYSFTVNGNFTTSSGTTKIMDKTGSTGTVATLTVTGNVLINGGTVDLSAVGTTDEGRLFVRGNLTLSSGALQFSQGITTLSSGVYFDGTGAQTFTHSGGTLSVATGGAGRRFYYKNASGPTALNETYSAGAAQTTVNGTEGVPASAGSYAAWPTSGTLINNLTIANTLGGVTMSSNKTVNGTTALTLTSGILTTTSTTQLTIGNTASTAISGGSTTCFVNGPLGWLATLSNSSTYAYPIGSGSTYLPLSVINPTGTTDTVIAQAFLANAGGTKDSTIDSLSTSEYWSLRGAVSSKVSVTRQTALGALNAIGRSTTKTGVYSALGSSTGGTTVTSTVVSTGPNQFFVLAKKAVAVVTLSGISTVAAANIAATTTNNIIYNFQLAVTGVPATLTAVTFPNTGTYNGSDFTNFKLYYTTTNTFATTNLLATISSPGVANPQSFTGFSTTINGATTGYFWITADVAAGATVGHTITVTPALAFSNLTFTNTISQSTGTINAGGTQTISAAPAWSITDFYLYNGAVGYYKNGSGGQGTTVYSGANLGTTNNMFLTDIRLYTTRNSAQSICSGTMYYSIYPSAGSPTVWSNVELTSGGTGANGPTTGGSSPQAQTLGAVSPNINILCGLATGTYKMAIYFTFSGNPSASTCPGTTDVYTDNNSGNYYIATFTNTNTTTVTSVAGTAINTCATSGAVNITTGAAPTNYSALLWTSSGTGTFANNTNLTTCTYTPSAADITAGSVTITLEATGNGTCTSTKVTSTKTLTIKATGTWLGITSDWNTASNWCGGVPTSATNVVIPSGTPNNPLISLANAVANTVTINSGAQLSMSGMYNLSITANGSFTNNATGTDFITTGSTGAVIFLGDGTISGTITFKNISYYGGLNFGSGSSVSDTSTIQSGGYTNINGPIYLTNSILRYKTGAAYLRRVEWSTTSGKSYPYHVLITGNTQVFASHPSALAANTPLNIAGDLTIDNGSQLFMDNFINGANDMTVSLLVGGSINLKGNLSASTTNGADIKLGKDWNFTVGGVFYQNSRAVWFTGNVLQNISRSAAGTLNFDYLINQNSAGGIKLSSGTGINFNGSGDAFQLLGTGTGNVFDLNGNTATMVNANNIKISGTQYINNTNATGANLNISATGGNVNSGTLLEFGTNVTVGLNNGFNFGNTLTTIKGTLSINSNGYVDTNPPTYFNNSVLLYNSTGTFSRNLEWSSGTGPGYPHHVTVQNGTTVDISANGGAARTCGGNLTLGVTGSAGSLTMGTMIAPLTVVGNVTIGGSTGLSTLTLGGLSGVNAGDIYIGGNWTRNGFGSFNPSAISNGRAVFFNTASASTITANLGETFPYLFISKNAKANTVTLAANITVTRELHLTTGTLQLSNSDITLPSSSANTAEVSKIANTALVDVTYGTGKFVIERYIPARRAWRLLCAPITSSQTINAAWQEGGQSTTLTGPASISNPVPGYGTHITGGIANNNGNTTIGFDWGLNTSSIFSYNMGAPVGWNLVPANTKTLSINSQQGWMLFVRGNRSNILSQGTSAALSATILRTKGQIKIGTSTVGSLPVGMNVIANPYPSAINFENVSRSANIGKTYYLWDANVPGAWQVGGFISFAATITPGVYTKTVVIPGGASSIPADGSIQSGAAFMVYNSSGTGSITIDETDKASGSNVYQFRPIGPATVSNQIRTTLNYIEPGTGNVFVNDGTVINYDSRYSNTIDLWDAVKPNNFVENFGISSGGQKIAIERRTAIARRDTIQYAMWKMRVRNYQLEFAFDDVQVPAGTEAFLEDTYLNTKSPVQLIDTTRVNFDVTGDVASAAENRFRMVFYPTVEYNLIKAYIVNRDIAVEWGVSEEVNLKEYEVERSLDGIHFTKQTTKKAIGNTQSPVNYIWLDRQPQSGLEYYYRVKSVSNYGTIVYSNIVKVRLPKNHPAIYVIGNPIQNNTIKIQMNSIDKGMFGVNLYNNIGQLVYSGSINHGQGTATEIINVEQALPKGTYQLKLTGMDNRMVDLQVMVE